MANLQVKNLPTQLHKRLHRYAKEKNQHIREIVIEAVKRELDRSIFINQLKNRTSVKLKTKPSRLLEDERNERKYK
ncbi:MAG: hypothetical protein JW841_00825 [Deltaproteobacteria bacterium]|nr:hypothetical protein [Deltaproteobacteria bacterium]